MKLSVQLIFEAFRNQYRDGSGNDRVDFLANYLKQKNKIKKGRPGPENPQLLTSGLFLVKGSRAGARLKRKSLPSKAASVSDIQSLPVVCSNPRHQR